MHSPNNVKKTALGHQILFPEVTTVDNAMLCGQDIGSVSPCGPPFLSLVIQPFQRDSKLLDRLLEDPLLTSNHQSLFMLLSMNNYHIQTSGPRVMAPFMDPRGDGRFGYLCWLGLNTGVIQVALRSGTQALPGMHWQLPVLRITCAYLGRSEHWKWGFG